MSFGMLKSLDVLLIIISTHLWPWRSEGQGGGREGSDSASCRLECNMFHLNASFHGYIIYLTVRSLCLEIGLRWGMEMLPWTDRNTSLACIHNFRLLSHFCRLRCCCASASRWFLRSLVACGCILRSIEGFVCVCVLLCNHTLKCE